MADISKDIQKEDKPIGEIAAEEVFHRHNEVNCIRCRESFIVERLRSSRAWLCPNCEKQNPNLYYYFILIGVLLAVGIIVNLILMILYMRAAGSNIRILYVMWGAAHMLFTGYAVIAIYGDKHSYGLKPLRYLVPAIFLSALSQAMTYQIRYSAANILIGAIIFGGIGAYIAYAFYLSIRMVEPHKAEESIVRPVYSMISITINIMLLLIFTTIVIQQSKRTPGTSKFDFGREGGYVRADAVQEDADEQVDRIDEDPDIDMPEIEINPIEIDVIDIDKIITTDVPTAVDIVIKKVPEEVRQKTTAQRELKNVKIQQRLNRADALRQGGGTDETEWAVLLALRWLKRHQNADGSWGEGRYRPALTGFALLAFLGHGEDHLSREFGATVQKAITYFIENQDEKGYFAQQDAQLPYQHGIASYAMAEAYGLTGLDDLKPVVDSAIRAIIAGQTSIGGWVYSYQINQLPGESGGDTSISGWQVQALKAAHSAGIRYSDGSLTNALANSIKNLKRVYDPNQQCFGYQSPGGTWQDNLAMTATGVLCMQFLGQFNASEVRNALSQMRKNYKFDWEETEGGRTGMPLYAWYYATQAFFQATDNPSTNQLWRYWNPQMQNALLKKQRRDGSWPLPAKSKELSHLGNSQKNADVYATAICCLMLEVYYRYLPTYRLMQ